MRTLLSLLCSSFLTLGMLSIAHAKELGPDQALKLRDAGTVMSFEKLNAAALAKHPGATVHETELEEEYGQYLYKVELRDTQNIEWDVELDATNGQVLKDHKDT